MHRKLSSTASSTNDAAAAAAARRRPPPPSSTQSTAKSSTRSRGQQKAASGRADTTAMGRYISSLVKVRSLVTEREIHHLGRHKRKKDSPESAFLCKLLILVCKAAGLVDASEAKPWAAASDLCQRRPGGVLSLVLSADPDTPLPFTYTSASDLLPPPPAALPRDHPARALYSWLVCYCEYRRQHAAAVAAAGSGDAPAAAASATVPAAAAATATPPESTASESRVSSHHRQQQPQAAASVAETLSPPESPASPASPLTAELLRQKAEQERQQDEAERRVLKAEREKAKAGAAEKAERERVQREATEAAAAAAAATAAAGKAGKAPRHEEAAQTELERQAAEIRELRERNRRLEAAAASIAEAAAAAARREEEELARRKAAAAEEERRSQRQRLEAEVDNVRGEQRREAARVDALEQRLRELVGHGEAEAATELQQQEQGQPTIVKEATLTAETVAIAPAVPAAAAPPTFEAAEAAEPAVEASPATPATPASLEEATSPLGVLDVDAGATRSPSVESLPMAAEMVAMEILEAAEAAAAASPSPLRLPEPPSPPLPPQEPRVASSETEAAEVASAAASSDTCVDDAAVRLQAFAALAWQHHHCISACCAYLNVEHPRLTEESQLVVLRAIADAENFGSPTPAELARSREAARCSGVVREATPTPGGALALPKLQGCGPGRGGGPGGGALAVHGPAARLRRTDEAALQQALREQHAFLVALTAACEDEGVGASTDPAVCAVLDGARQRLERG